MTENRKSRRFDLRLPIQLLRAGPAKASMEGETQNVSSSGVLFRSDVAIAIGDSVEYVIALPGMKDAAEVRLRCLGKVVRLVSETEAAATLERYEFIRG